MKVFVVCLVSRSTAILLVHTTSVSDLKELAVSTDFLSAFL